MLGMYKTTNLYEDYSYAIISKERFILTVKKMDTHTLRHKIPATENIYWRDL